jgi:phage anti-repressor protein
VDNYNDWIQSTLDQLDFVEWDRFIEFKNDDGNRITRVFGWIDRPDEHEDFVHLEFVEAGKSVLFLGTSSKMYTQKINEILYGESNTYLECHRVENRFSTLENKIQIETKDMERKTGNEGETD